MSSGVKIRYGDVAPEAKENFQGSINDSKFNTIQQLQKYNLNFPNYGNPCETYSVLLDGKAEPFPSDPNNSNIGIISNQISDDNGNITNSIVLQLTSDKQYTSPGLTFMFDTYNDIYPKKINIQWKRNINGVVETLANKDFFPDNAFYFCSEFVEYYNQLVITFSDLNMPKNRFKLKVIDYGYGTFFLGDELRDVKLIQEFDPISLQTYISTADFTLDSKSDIVYNFQVKQPLDIYFDDNFKASMFVKHSTRLAKRLWQVQSEDYISLMDSIPYLGGIYNNTKVVDVLNDIFKVAGEIPYNIDPVFLNKTITGHIPYTTCRDALTQVAFAIQAGISTAESNHVNIISLQNAVEQPIPLNRIMQGQSFSEDDTVTKVQITVHSFEPTSLDKENRVYAYNAETSGIGNNILVIFSEPLHSLYVPDYSDGEIISYGANHAYINARSSNFSLFGYKYEHITSIKEKVNPLKLSYESDNVISVENATLVSQNNIDNVLNMCYNWLIKTQYTNTSIIEGKHILGNKKIKWGEFTWGNIKWGQKTPKIIEYDKPVKLGDMIKVETEYMGIVEGRVIKQSYNLNGGIIVKEVVVK